MTTSPPPLVRRSAEEPADIEESADHGMAEAAPVLRRDAARNRDKILVAARAAFDEEGVDVGVETIAQRAGVGVGTLYRRFPTKELLIEAVVDEILQGILSAAQAALENESPADGFGEFLRAVGWLQFEHTGCLARLWNNTASDVRGQIEVATRALLARAQSVGAVRHELVYEDVTVLFWSLRGVIEATSSVSTEAWLRHLDLLLSSLAPSDQPLAHPPLTAEQVQRAKDVLSLREVLRGRRPSGG
jgi:AcrR family transcriptional regulator